MSERRLEFASGHCRIAGSQLAADPRVRRSTPGGHVPLLESLQAPRQRTATLFRLALQCREAFEIRDRLRNRRRGHGSRWRFRCWRLRADETRQDEEGEAGRSKRQSHRADQQAAAEAFAAQRPGRGRVAPGAVPLRLHGQGIGGRARLPRRNARCNGRCRVTGRRLEQQVQLLVHDSHGDRPVIGPLGEAARDQSAEGLGRIRPARNRWRDLVMHARGRHVRVERRVPAHEFIEQHAEGVDVVRHGGSGAVEPLGTRRIGRRTGRLRRTDPARAAEVDESRQAVAVEQHVGRFEVAVNPARSMELRQCLDHRQQPARDQRPGSPAQAADLAAREKLEDIERFVARVVRGNRREQRRVIDDGADAFAGKITARTETQHDVTVGVRVPREPGRAVVPGGERPREFVSRSHDLPACARHPVRHRSGLSACRWLVASFPPSSPAGPSRSRTARAGDAAIPRTAVPPSPSARACGPRCRRRSAALRSGTSC